MTAGPPESPTEDSVELVRLALAIAAGFVGRGGMTPRDSVATTLLRETRSRRFAFRAGIVLDSEACASSSNHVSNFVVAGPVTR